MRDRPFIPASEQPRPFSEVLAERRAMDPAVRFADAAMDQVLELESQAAEAADPATRKRLQCEAEDLRCAMTRR